jgi:hypothetical protein
MASAERHVGSAARGTVPEGDVNTQPRSRSVRLYEHEQETALCEQLGLGSSSRELAAQTPETS